MLVPTLVKVLQKTEPTMWVHVCVRVRRDIWELVHVVMEFGKA